MVLVTGRQTFKLTKAETSNTLLVVPPVLEEPAGGVGEVGEEGVEAAREAAAAAATGRSFQAVAALGFQYEVLYRTHGMDTVILASRIPRVVRMLLDTYPSVRGTLVVPPRVPPHGITPPHFPSSLDSCEAIPLDVVCSSLPLSRCPPVKQGGE